MPQRDPGVYLEDIEHYAAAATRFIAGCSLEQFLADEKTRAAVERVLEICGEAMSGLYKAAPAIAEKDSAGYVPCSSSREVAQESEIVITMLPDTPDVESVLFGPSGLAEGLAAGKLLRYELHVADRNPRIRTAHRRYRRRLPRRTCLGRRARCAGRVAHDHGGRQSGSV